MDKLGQYRTYIQQLLKQYGEYRPSTEEFEVEMITDTQHDHYQLVTVGWRNHRRIYGCFLHIDIKNGKIWIQHNGTEEHVAHELVALGVPKEDIVLGFHSPSRRKFTEFAVN